METGEEINSIPIDLIIEILSRVPAKSIVRFRCVSKLWGSMLHGPYFTELFLTMSRTRPRLLFVIEQAGELYMYSLPQPHNPYEKPSLVVDVTNQIKLINTTCFKLYSCSYASGLICYYDVRVSNGYGNNRVICNPSTGQWKTLPKLKKDKMSTFLGFDPIDKQFKVLSMGSHHSWSDHQVMTLGNGKMNWRKIQCPLAYKPSTKGICINGVLYYFAEKYDGSKIIVCFDVRSEKFKFIPASFGYWYTKLINYKGKLGVINWLYMIVGAIQLRILVLEDVEKHEWSKSVYTLQDIKIVNPCNVSVAGVTSTGEIVFSMDYASKPFYVFYFNLERKTLQTVEIQGNRQVFDDRTRVHLFVDHVEELKFNMMNAKSISPPSVSSSAHQHHLKKIITSNKSGTHVVR